MPSVTVGEYEEWRCSCGNIAGLDGFQPCNEAGEVMEPEPGWPYLYRCDRCGAIYRDVPGAAILHALSKENP